MTEHGARMSRTYKQRKPRKLKKTTQAKSKITKARNAIKAKKTEGIGLLYNHKAYKKKKQGYYIAQRLYRL